MVNKNLDCVVAFGYGVDTVRPKQVVEVDNEFLDD
jgi:hypothetical protein